LVLGRAARARVLAARGLYEEAERVGRDAVELSEETDDLNMRADTCVSFAEVLAAAGDRAGARLALATSLELYEAKGNVAAAATTRSRAATLEP